MKIQAHSVLAMLYLSAPGLAWSYGGYYRTNPNAKVGRQAVARFNPRGTPAAPSAVPAESIQTSAVTPESRPEIHASGDMFHSDIVPSEEHRVLTALPRRSAIAATDPPSPCGANAHVVDNLFQRCACDDGYTFDATTHVCTAATAAASQTAAASGDLRVTRSEPLAGMKNPCRDGSFCPPGGVCQCGARPLPAARGCGKLVCGQEGGSASAPPPAPSRVALRRH